MGNKQKMNTHHRLCKFVVNILMLLIGLGSTLYLPATSGTAAPLPQDNLPTYGWVVDEDLDVGEVPGLPDVQRFRMRHQDDWELLAYCVDPNIDPPAEGTTCQLINEDTFWCGDGVQHLRIYQILQTPPAPSPTATHTPTSTPTHTPTFTPTSTQTHTLTSTPTLTQTPTSTQTPIPTVTTTPKPTQEATQAEENKPTPTPRSRSGQSGIVVQQGEIVRWSLGGTFIVFAAILAVLEWKRYLHNKRK